MQSPHDHDGPESFAGWGNQIRCGATADHLAGEAAATHLFEHKPYPCPYPADEPLLEATAAGSSMDSDLPKGQRSFALTPKPRSAQPLQDGFDGGGGVQVSLPTLQLLAEA